MTVEDILGGVLIRRRQDLEYLKKIAEGKERFLPPMIARRNVTKEEKARELEELTRVMNVAVSPKKNKDKITFLEDVGVCPVSGILNPAGLPLHPAGVHQEKGIATTARVYGGSAVDKAFLAAVLDFVPASALVEPASKYVYTHGEQEGFYKRLKEQTTRRCVKVTQYPFQLDAPRGGWNTKYMVNILKERFPLKSHLPDWSRDIDDQFLEISTSKISSAGAPYWRDKEVAMVDVQTVGLPLIVDAIKEGKISELYREQQEMFLCEVKNKLDRYEPSKLTDKARPYFAFPFHWQALFSMLSQPFSAALAQFYEKPGCANAYGMSWAHGGAARAVEWARRTESMVFYCYGDDSDLYWRENGILYRVSPDFRQMDGSVDRRTVEIAIEYIIQCYREQHPSPETEAFWREVGKMWVEFATDPIFLVDGPTVYKKHQTDGLATGVVGTTFFDTVKSVLAYESFREMYMRPGRPSNMLTAEYATKFFQERGLEIKEGTWVPEMVQEEPVAGHLFGQNKFLGMQLLYVQGPERVEPVPHLSDEDWLTTILAPRDDPLADRKTLGSRTGRLRTLFDRLRGYMVTGAFSSENIARLCGSLVNEIPAEIILMAVQADKGRGEKPEMSQPLGGVGGANDFSFPTSEGFPTELWCQDLYFSEDNQWKDHDQPGAQWQLMYPTMDSAIKEWKKTWRNSKPVMKIETIKVPVPGKQQVQKSVLNLEVEDTVTGPPATILDIPEDLELREQEPKREKGKPKSEIPKTGNPRSKIVRVVSTATGVAEAPPLKDGITPPKQMPTLEQTLARVFKEEQYSQNTIRKLIQDARKLNPGETPETASLVLVNWALNQDGLQDKYPEISTVPVVPLYQLAAQLGRNPYRLGILLRTYGYYVIGKGASTVVLDRPVAFPDKEYVDQVKEQTAENQERLRGVSKSYAQKAKRVPKGEVQVTYADAVKKPSETLKKVVERAEELPPAEVPQQVELLPGVALRPLAKPWNTKMNIVNYWYQVCDANHTIAGWTTETHQVRNKAYCTTTLSLDGVAVARRLGNSIKENKKEIARAAIRRFLQGEPIPALTTTQKTRARQKRNKRRAEIEEGWEDQANESPDSGVDEVDAPRVLPPRVWSKGSNHIDPASFQEQPGTSKMEPTMRPPVGTKKQRKAVWADEVEEEALHEARALLFVPSHAGKRIPIAQMTGELITAIPRIGEIPISVPGFEYSEEHNAFLDSKGQVWERRAEETIPAFLQRLRYAVWNSSQKQVGFELSQKEQQLYREIKDARKKRKESYQNRGGKIKNTTRAKQWET